MPIDQNGDDCRDDQGAPRTARANHGFINGQSNHEDAVKQRITAQLPVPNNPRYLVSHQPSKTSNDLRSVVTSSFSLEDDRDETHIEKRFSSERKGSMFFPASRSNYASGLMRSEEDRCPSYDHVRNLNNAFHVPLVNKRFPPFDVHRPSADERIPPPHDAVQPVMIPPSPPDASAASSVGAPGTSLNNRSRYQADHRENLKRNFWHHAQPDAHYEASTMHPAFIPPKRAKLSTGQLKDHPTLTPRAPPETAARIDHSQSTYVPPRYDRTISVGAHESDRDGCHVRKSSSFPLGWEFSSYRPPVRSELRENPEQEFTACWGTARGGSSPSQSPRFRKSHWQRDLKDWKGYDCESRQEQQPISPPHSKFHSKGGSWSVDMHAAMSKQRHHQESRISLSSEEIPNYHQVAKKRTVVDSHLSPRCAHVSDEQTNVVNHTLRTHAPHNDGIYQAKPTGFEFTSVVQDESKGNSSLEGDKLEIATASLPLRLLAQPEDRISLSETLCTIRENIEVFTATKADVEAPAPGRKHPVVVGQVGLRCIHCRSNKKLSDRVKRAVCYPSSIKRIYRTVIDMKLDHFQYCKFVPVALKERLEALKAINTRSTGTTMQYFLKAAKKMGMVDGPTGVRLATVASVTIGTEDSQSEASSTVGFNPGFRDPGSSERGLTTLPDVESTQLGSRRGKSAKIDSPSSVGHSEQSIQSSPRQKDELGQQDFTGKVVLALPDDKMALSPLRCFLRENVCAFSATEEDIAVRTPTTFSVVSGQVGIGCIHCHSLPARERSNRAVCFPFSIARIYQSVADIQRFHLSECKMVPDEVKKRFLSLQSASSKGSKGLATRQYWVTSARKIGLVDTPRGIRFGRDPSIPSAPAVSLDILAQVASNVTTVGRPLVLPEDESCIAEFLYRVMEQLQPCRFTEADRNKRRLKDVGCIGVECKHCAGKVESRKFFWSSVNAVESNFVSVHTHMMECRMVPPSLKEELAKLKKLRKEQTARLKTGSQKAFFARVWKRLHGESDSEWTAASKVENVSKGIKTMTVVSV